MQKQTTLEKTENINPKLYGNENADITLVSWGSNKGSILDAIRGRDNVNYLHLTWMNPFPSEFIKQTLEKAKHVVNIECNITAQLGSLIREKTGFEITDNFLKYDGRPIFPEEIVEKINSINL